jgi:glycosyltransferase involved in cell wall biosynthesis
MRPGELLVLAVGRLVDLKGHEILLRACASLAHVDPGAAWRVVIAGRGEREEHLRSVVAELGQESRVQLLGHRDDVADLLAAADIFVLPSLFEGLPVAVLEAMFAGKPVLASAISGVPDALDHGRAGLLVPPADIDALARGLQSLLTSSALRERLGRAGQARAAAQYSVARMVDRYEEAYGLAPGVAPRNTAHEAHAAPPDGLPRSASGAEGEVHCRSAGSAERA